MPKNKNNVIIQDSFVPPISSVREQKSFVPPRSTVSQNQSNQGSSQEKPAPENSQSNQNQSTKK